MDVLESLKLKFTSDNCYPVRRAIILKEEYDELIDRLQTANEKVRQYEALILNK